MNYSNLTKLVISSIFIIIILTISVSAASNIPSFKDKYMNDFANVLDQRTSTSLRSLFEFIDQNTTAEVVFVSVNGTNGYALSDYATQIGQTWGVGKADKDNGIVILYDSETKKIFVAVGYGVEGILPDSKIGRLLDDYYVPQRDAGNLSKGIEDFSFAMSQVLLDNSEEIRSGQSSGKPSNDAPDFAGIVAVIVFWVTIVVVINIIRNRGLKGKNKSSIPWWVLLFIPRSSGSSGFSGGGFGGGGGGFGGGGFGGGGAGR